MSATSVYMLRGASGRHYIGVSNDLVTRLAQHRRGHTATTKRLGGDLELVASHGFSSRSDALAMERRLKAWKNPAKAIEYLHSLSG